MYVLECEDYKDVITWDPSGLSFVIIDPKVFEKRVLPEIFKEAKFASFQRKVNISYYLTSNVVGNVIIA